MAKKEDLKDTVITKIPSDEKILKEGVLEINRINKKTQTLIAYKYAITEKGIWTRSKGMFLVKPETRFTPYEHFESFEAITYMERDCCLFHPKSGDVSNRVYFDDREGAIEILEGYIERKEDGDE